MYDAKNAVCCVEGCESNMNAQARACCRACGRCGNDSFHVGCNSTSCMRESILSDCSNESCNNSRNGLQVLVCVVCGKCGACSFHEH
jgi:hypothetical protein